jgi:membrane protein involved in colicin uptake
MRAANKAAQQKYQAPIKAARAEARAKAKAEKDAKAGESPEDAAKKQADEEAKAEADEEAKAQEAEKLKTQTIAVLSDKFGGREWEKGDKHRVYLDGDKLFDAMNVKVVKGGYTQDAISKGYALEIRSNFRSANPYYDVKTSTFTTTMKTSQETTNWMRDAFKIAQSTIPVASKRSFETRK